MLATISYILNHPLNRHRKLAALIDFVCWQVRSRAVPGLHTVPFVEGTKLRVSRGMTGATGNIYCGLHEFEDMAFVLHGLRPGDLFVDVGANVGSYTILAAGVCAAKCIACEPVPATFAHLLGNVQANHCESLVDARNIGVGSEFGTLSFTTDGDTVNHVIPAGIAAAAGVAVRVEPLDGLLGALEPVIIKIDVEGFEAEVLKGAAATMQRPTLLAVIMELNGSGARYGFDEKLLHERMTDWGFVARRYDPFRRKLLEPGEVAGTANNTIYVRETAALYERLRTASSRSVRGVVF